jgi:serine/threonine protein phosphatase PrpC
MSLKLEVAGRSDVGCLRSNNEDNFGYDTRCGIFVVCDGMGGMAAGEVAAKIGVDIVVDYFRAGKASGSYPPYGNHQDGVSENANAVGSAIQLANAAIFDASARVAGQSGMGATIVAVHVDGDSYSIGHVGDSRIYLVRKDTIKQLTNDHSLVMEQVRRGLITAEQARTSEVQNIIIRALGSEPSVQVDLEDFVAAPGDVLLLCSDGLTRHADDQDLLNVISNESDMASACDALIEFARGRGGEDNITAVLVRFADQSVLGKLFGGGEKWQDSI